MSLFLSSTIPPEPCRLPDVVHGRYVGVQQEEGGTVQHGVTVDYACEEGWLVNVAEVRCQLGQLRPGPPACVTPVQATHSLPAPLKRTASSE